MIRSSFSFCIFLLVLASASGGWAQALGGDGPRLDVAELQPIPIEPPPVIDPILPPPGCEDRCAFHARESVADCVRETGDEVACAERGAGAFELCVETSCVPAPSCDDRCALRAKSFHRHCVDLTGDREACAERARALLERCIGEHCEPPAPTCEERCTGRAKRFFESCVELTGDEAACGLRARALREDCIDTHCNGEPPVCEEPEPPSCEDRCIAHARHLHAACVDSGRPEATCARQAKQAARRCARQHCARR